MRDIILYTIDCPKCKALEMQLEKRNIEFSTVRDINVMKHKGFKYAPVLEVNGQVMAFEDAILWVKGGGLS